MNTHFGKTQINAGDNFVPVFGLEEALSAEIADGDFRTYVLLCQLAWQEHADAEAPYTERTYEEMARLHPSRRSPTAETVRGRLYRLARAGLVRRERTGRTTWRTYPLLEEGAAFLGGWMHHTQPHVYADGRDGHTQGGATAYGYVDRTHPEHGGRTPTHPQTSDRAGSTHPQVGGQPAHAQTPDYAAATHPDGVSGQQGHGVPGEHAHDRAAGTHPRAITAQGQHTQPAGCADRTHPQPLGEQLPTQPSPEQAAGAHPQPLGGQGAPTQEPAAPGVGGPSEHTQGDGNTLGGQLQHAQAASQQPVGELQRPTQKAPAPCGPEAATEGSVAPGCGAGTHPDPAPLRAEPQGEASRAHARASVLISTGTDPLSLDSFSTQEREQYAISTEGRPQTKASLVSDSADSVQNIANTPGQPDLPLDHPVFQLVNVPKGYEALAVTLATLSPKRMNYEGIEECLKQPDLTQAWFEYALSRQETIHSLPAYIRHGVRSGVEPPQAEAQCPGSSKRYTYDPNDFGWDDPIVAPERYAKYQFDYGEWPAPQRHPNQTH